MMKTEVVVSGGGATGAGVFRDLSLRGIDAILLEKNEFTSGTSNKFWEVGVAGKKVTARYGKIGTDGQTSLKEFDTPAAAKAHADKKVAEKVKEGYVEK